MRLAADINYCLCSGTPERDIDLALCRDDMCLCREIAADKLAADKLEDNGLTASVFMLSGRHRTLIGEGGPRGGRAAIGR